MVTIYVKGDALRLESKDPNLKIVPSEKGKKELPKTVVPTPQKGD